MSTNPNPTYITNEMWKLWDDCVGIIPSVKLGGIYANKSGFHNTVNANKSRWPNDYSLKGIQNLTGPYDKARAIDLTMSNADMVTYTQRLINACNANDPRVAGMREFFGTVDLKNVVGRAHDSDTGAWRFTTSDSSHLWHIHISIFTFYCNNAQVMSGIASVLKGESLADWISGGGNSMLCKKGQTGEVVKAMQMLLNEVGIGAPINADASYGPATSAKLAATVAGFPGVQANGENYGACEWSAVFVQLAKKYAGKDGEDGEDGTDGDNGAGLAVGDVVTFSNVRIGIDGDEQRIVGTVAEVTPA